MNRRAFLRTTSSLLAPAMMSRVLQDANAPAMPGGVQVGDVTDTRAMIWSATDRPARMLVELSRDERFTSPRLIEGPAALEDTRFTAKIDLGGLTPGEPVFYRVWFDDLARPGLLSAQTAGQFRAAPSAASPLTICWSGDVVGQGWGIDEARGGMRLYETMARHSPDLFIHSGDQIYADGPLRPEVTLDDGTVWRNVVTEAKQKVAETLDEFRGNFAYNLLDRHARAFNSQVPMIVQWDDHEVLNNWSPGTDLGARPQYTERSIAMLAARAKRAMFEYLPIRSHPDEAERVYRAYQYGPLAEVIVLDQRSYRSANGGNRQASDADIACHMENHRQRHAAWIGGRQWAARRRADVRGVGQRSGRAAGARTGVGGHPDVHPRPTRAQHRLGDRRRALRGGPPLRSGRGRVQGFRAFLGVRGGPAPRRHVRPQQARPDLWLHASLQQRACRPQTQPSAK
jgi:alkaline phosphatase D